MSNNIYDLTRFQLAVLRWRYRLAAVLWVLACPVWLPLVLLACASMWPCKLLQQPYDRAMNFDAADLWTRIPTDEDWCRVNKQVKP